MRLPILTIGVLVTLLSFAHNCRAEDESVSAEPDAKPDPAEFASVDDDNDDEADAGASKVVEPMDFVTPDKPQGNYYFADAFRDQSGIGSRWILSTAKKDDIEESLSKYDGEWSISSLDTEVLRNDFGLQLKSKAHHHAIASMLNRPFKFVNGKLLVVQYSVQFQEGQECGGAYLKLLSAEPEPALATLHDKTPYSIMFGPDKCGLSSKLHFIVRFRNPKTGTIEEKHAKQPDKINDGIFTDKKAHLYTLVLNPDGSYQVLVDQSQVMKGSLLETMEPAIIPVKEIPDPDEKKPEDWDDREKIPDPDAAKPEDWDEEAPEYVVDPADAKPEGWLDDEPELVPDPEAQKPADWDPEMDGEWEPAKIKNPKCTDAPGCGPYVPKQIKNPEFKGKWKAPMIKNENYKGKWAPKNIENPEYFEEEKPFLKLTPIAAVGLELWSMSAGIMFDDFLLTDDKAVADSWAQDTWVVKKKAESRYANKSSMFGSLIEAAGERPWLWAVYVLTPLLPIVLIVYFCCAGPSKSADEEDAKKTDAPQPDDYDADEPVEEVPAEALSSNRADLEGSSDDSPDQEEQEEEDNQENDAAAGEPAAHGSPRRRKARRDQ